MTHTQQPYLFISYRSIEQDIALKVAHHLLLCGVATWMDQLGGIIGGDDWIQALQAGIDNAAGMIVMLSPAYTKSKFCIRELNRADSREYPIIPLLIADVSDDRIPFALTDRHYINFTSYTNASQLPVLFDELLKAVIKQTPCEAGPALPLPPRRIDLQAVQARRTEDDLVATQTTLDRLDSSKLSMRLKRDRLQAQLVQLEERYTAATNQMLGMMDEDARVVLRFKLENLSREVAQIEAVLIALNKA